MAAPEEAKLRKAIEILVPKIQKFRDQQINEETTKSAMISPLLQALGWDISDPETVKLEYKGDPKFNPVDYALMAQGQIKLLVEAKRLGEDLTANKGITEILANAAVTGGADWGLLTDGDEYRIYKTNVTVDANQKLFRTVRISKDNPDKVVSTLSLLSQPNMAGKRRIDDLWTEQFVDYRVRTALQAMLNPADTGYKGLIHLIRHKFRELKAKDISGALARLEVHFGPIRPVEEKFVPVEIDRPEGEGGMATFRRLMETGQPILKATLIEKLMETGVSKSTADAYVVWAKRIETGAPNENKNPFDFCVIESRDESGNKIITRSNGPDSEGQAASGKEVFRGLFKTKTDIKRADVIAAVMKAGVKEQTANSYIVWACNYVKEFGFLTEEYELNGVKMLRRI